MRILYLFMYHFCGNCAYFIPSKNLYLSTCVRFAGQYTDVCRKDKSICGSEGNYYLSKDYDPYIPELKTVSCRNCKHYDSSYQRCRMFFKINDVTGVKTLDSCVLCRDDQNKCGKYGRFFTPYPSSF